MASNSENQEWNNRYNGLRVPINDTGLPGAPCALSSDDSEWADGSVNKAMYNQIIVISGEFPEGADKINAEAGKVDLLHCALYIVSDMLYGFGGDSRNTIPTCQMAYRGYPTPVINDFSLLAKTPASGLYINFDGSTGATQNNIVLTHRLDLKYAMAYKPQYTIELLVEGVEKYQVEIQIGSAKSSPSAYRLLRIDGIDQNPEDEELPWITLQNGEIYFSFPSDALSGDQSYTLTSSMFSNNDPYYGTLPQQDLVVSEAEYKPVSGSVSLGPCKEMDGSFDPYVFLNNCSEIPLQEFTARPNATLYVPEGSSIVAGLRVYLDVDLTVAAPQSKYIWTQYDYTYIGSEMYRITHYMSVDNQGRVVDYYINVNDVGDPYCYYGGSLPTIREVVLGDGDIDPSVACYYFFGTTYWTNTKSSLYLDLGDTIYTDEEGTLFDGGLLYYNLINSTAAVKINGFGIVVAIISCQSGIETEL